jgi:hypothetical protein
MIMLTDGPKSSSSLPSLPTVEERARPSIAYAEDMVRELAYELRGVPVDKATQALHLEALRYMRLVRQWREVAPSEQACNATLDELQRLIGEAERRRSMACSGMERILLRRLFATAC